MVSGWLGEHLGWLAIVTGSTAAWGVGLAVIGAGDRMGWIYVLLSASTAAILGATAGFEAAVWWLLDATRLDRVRWPDG